MPAGSYDAGSGDASSIPCAPGSDTAGATGATACTPAPASSYDPTAGDAISALCPAGTYSSSPGEIACTPAPAGSYAAGTGNTTATLCPAGSYSSSPSEAACTPAPPNTYVASTGATTPTDCPGDTFNPNSGSTSAAACTMVGVADPGNQSNDVNAPIAPLTSSASNGILPLTWSATGLPTGLFLVPTTGTITGTPTTPCACSVALTATDSQGHAATVDFIWNILSFGISTTSIPSVTPGVGYGSVNLQAAGEAVSANPYSTTLKWRKVSLPRGLRIARRTGVLSGTPNARLTAGASSITVKVTETVTTFNGNRKVTTKTTVKATIPVTIT
jgi:Putative Ig domain/Tyrosine-protein kinase ephrin type A/B receptor-like